VPLLPLDKHIRSTKLFAAALATVVLAPLGAGAAAADRKPALRGTDPVTGKQVALAQYRG